MMIGHTDTIVAVSSPPGRSLRGLIRITGPQTVNILKQLTPGPPGSALENSPERKSPSGRTSNTQTSLLAATSNPNTSTAVNPSCGDLPLPPRYLTATAIVHRGFRLPCLAAFFQGPASYTGHDMAELQIPGNPALLDRLVHQILGLGARSAEPGEFTFRAYLSGKLDLTQAEGIAATINATSEAQLHAATLLREGKLGHFAQEAAEHLATSLALVEAGIDFTDQDDVVPIGPDDLWDRLSQVHGQLDTLLRNSRRWGAVEALPRVILVGEPSSGKSTLFNALLGEDRAVTSPIPGTTRDLLTEPLALERDDGQTIEVMLIDLAGLDNPVGALDHAIQKTTRQAIEQADVLIHLGPVEPAPHVIQVAAKADMQPSQSQATPQGLPVSAHTGRGIDELKKRITQAVGNRGVSIQAQKLALQPRHEETLRQAADHLDQAQQWVLPQQGQRTLDDMELIASSLRSALNELGALGGQMTPDDVIGRVFATFCVGK